jgi:hypothetical protein
VRFVLIANPGTPRCETYRREFHAFWAARGGAAELDVVPWADVVPRDGNLDDLPAFDRPAVVRLESPGKNESVYRQILAVGARDDPKEEVHDWLAEPLPKGLLLRPGLWFRGFKRVLCGLRRSFDTRPHLTPTACPLAVTEMFDKTATAKRLSAAGIPVPDMLEHPAAVIAFIRLTETDRWSTAYVKLNAGSSAVGIVFVRSNPEHGRLEGTTGLVEIDGAFYNSRRLRRINGADLSGALEFVLREGAIVQRGIPLAQIDGQNFDVRVVCLHGTPVATIFRLSPHPMTNLHLGGRRGDYARCRAAIPTRDWLDALDHCAEAAACFDSAVAGVDLVFEPGFRRHAVLEVNAFGDFFPGWVDAAGRSIHALGLEAAARAFSSSR